MLVPHSVQTSAVNKAHAAVQLHGGNLIKFGLRLTGSNSNNLSELQLSAVLNQSLQQGTCYAPTPVFRCDIDGAFNSCRIGWTGAIGAGVTITSYCPVYFGNQIGVALVDKAGHACGHFILRRRVMFKTDKFLNDGPTIYGRNVGDIEPRGWTYLHVLAHMLTKKGASCEAPFLS